MRSVFIAVIFLITLNSSAQLQSTSLVNNKTSFENISYKTSENGNRLLLDVFLPEQKISEAGHPVLVVIHGGGWVEGDKSMDSVYYLQKLRESANQNGFAVVSINYSLIGKDIHFPNPVADCKDAVRWVRANAGKFGFDPDNIGLWGGSAGAHLALLIAYSPEDMWQGNENLQQYSGEVDYVIDNFGPANLNKLFKTKASFMTVFFFKTFLPKLYDIRNKLIMAMTGASLEDDEEKAIEILKDHSSVEYADSTSVPTLIVHGTKDRIVPLSESKKLHKLLNKLNVENEIILIKKGNHGFSNLSEEETDSIVNKTILFMKRHTD